MRRIWEVNFFQHSHTHKSQKGFQGSKMEMSDAKSMNSALDEGKCKVLKLYREMAPLVVLREAFEMAFACGGGGLCSHSSDEQCNNGWLHPDAQVSAMSGRTGSRLRFDKQSNGNRAGMACQLRLQ